MSFKKICAAAVSVLLLAGAAGCGTGDDKSGAGDSPPSAVLAVVNGAKITADDFKEEASALSPYALDSLADAEAREAFLGKLIDKQLIVQEATSMGLTKDPEVVRQLSRVRDNLVLSLYINREIMDKASVTDEELKTYFDNNRDSLGSVRLSHIVVQSQAEAEEVLVKFKTGESFKKLAKDYSVDTSTSDKGGDLGFVRWDEFGTPDLKAAAFSLTPGEVSSIVKSRFGFHVLRVTDKKPAGESDFETLKGALREELEAKKQEKLFESTLSGLKDKAKIESDKEALASLSFLRPADLTAPGAPGPEGEVAIP